jgi:hypothetical protein
MNTTVMISIGAIIIGFLGGFIYRSIMKFIASKKPLMAIRAQKNIGSFDRIQRVIIAILFLAIGIAVPRVAIFSFLVTGFCLFEAIFSWCGFYAAIGKSTCPIE